jgi:hypothetical protein
MPCSHHGGNQLSSSFVYGVGIRAALELPPWILLQFQECGSYRTEDCLDFLDWALEPAACPQESIIVLLDWFAPHLSAEVRALVSSKGHVLLHHGGGVTGIEQVNAPRPNICPVHVVCVVVLRTCACCACLCCARVVVLVECFVLFVCTNMRLTIRMVVACWLCECGCVCGAKDTHLHALFQRLMEQLEVSVAHEKRKEDPNRVPKLSRQEVIDVVREVAPTIRYHTPANFPGEALTTLRAHMHTYIRTRVAHSACVLNVKLGGPRCARTVHPFLHRSGLALTTSPSPAQRINRRDRQCP